MCSIIDIYNYIYITTYIPTYIRMIPLLLLQFFFYPIFNIRRGENGGDDGRGDVLPRDLHNTQAQRALGTRRTRPIARSSHLSRTTSSYLCYYFFPPLRTPSTICDIDTNHEPGCTMRLQSNLPLLTHIPNVPCKYGSNYRKRRR